MRFYEITHNSSYERQWTMAVSIEPRSHLIRWSCPDCGRATSYPAGAFDVTIEGGKAYPDILGCGAYPFLIVSDKVLSSWQKCGIGLLATYPVKIAKALETDLSPESARPYFRLEIGGCIKVDIPRSGGKITEYCFRCGEFQTEPMLIKKFAFLEGSWDGSHLFRDQRFFPTVVFCTDSVKQLAENEMHTNFRFEEMR